MRIFLSLVMLISSMLLAHIAWAAPPAPNHPIIGVWEFTPPDSKCSETYEFKADGTTLVSSGEEIAESVYEISAQPSPIGFYKFDDTITRDNGKKDCAGEITQAGHKVTSFVQIHPSGEMFIMCEAESLDACFGPMKRKRVAGQ